MASVFWMHFNQASKAWFFRNVIDADQRQDE
jgi:hypothetical protein